MKLMDLCETTCVPMVLYDGHFGVEFARIDGKNGVVEKVLDCSVSYIGLNDNMLHIETDFSVSNFIRDNFSEFKLYHKIIETYIDYSLAINDITIKIVKYSDYLIKGWYPGCTIKYIYQIGDCVYTKNQIKYMILKDEDFLLHITKNWNNYELEWDL